MTLEFKPHIWSGGGGSRGVEEGMGLNDFFKVTINKVVMARLKTEIF